MGPSLRLILASNSRGRRELMTMHHYTFEVMPSNIDEPTEARLGDCRQYVGELAWLKAAAIAGKVDEGIIIAADTVGWLDDAVVGKPDDEAHARRIIQSLSGRVHELWTGVCLWRRPDNLQLTWQERSCVQMKKLNHDEIESYLQTRQWEGCSGAYALTMPVDPFLSVIEGSTSNVIGLPMESLGRYLTLI